MRGRGTAGLRRAREIPALLFAVAWILGFEVGPALHLLRHSHLASHVHGAAAGCHDGHCHEDEASGPAEDPDHGEGSVEHRGLAALSPALVLIAVTGAVVAEMVVLDRATSCASGVDRDLSRARGPPSS